MSVLLWDATCHYRHYRCQYRLFRQHTKKCQMQNGKGKNLPIFQFGQRLTAGAGHGTRSLYLGSKSGLIKMDEDVVVQGHVEYIMVVIGWNAVISSADIQHFPVLTEPY